LVGLVELVCRIAREPLTKALSGTFLFGVYAGVLAVALTAGSLIAWPAEGIDSPLMAVKEVYWSAASRNDFQKQDFGNVAWEMGVTSFVAPEAARYPSQLPSNPYLWDLRGQNYSLMGWAAVLAWIGLLAYGLAAAARDRERWPVWAIAVSWVAFNILLHSVWQYRGSVFLYTANAHGAWFLLALAGARSPQNPIIYRGAVAFTTLLLALNNLTLYNQIPALN
jgi:hypothetical protein